MAKSIRTLFIWQNLYKIKVNRKIKIFRTHLAKVAELKGGFLLFVNQKIGWGAQKNRHNATVLLNSQNLC